MSGALILYLLGMALVFAGQRMFGGDDAVAPILTGAGALAVVGSLVLRVQARGKATHDTARDAHKTALVYMGVGALSLAVYALSTDWAATTFGLGDDQAETLGGVFGALWPIFWLAGTLPALFADRAIQGSPLAVQPLRVKQAVSNGLISALGVALIFPVNYLASATNQRFDFAYFKTTEVGGPSRALVANLTEPVACRVFLPTSSDVEAEILPYFEALAAENPLFTVEVVDHAANPVLAERLKVRGNGYVALTLNEGTDDETTKSWKVGEDLDKAKRNLKKLDEEFQKRMLDLVRGDHVVYFTVGHGELNWKGGDTDEEQLADLKRGLGDINFKAKELGLKQGLSDAVPSDASVVVIMGNEDPFMDAELDALREYLKGGGSLLVAAEPDDENLAPLLADLGLKLGEGSLASETSYMVRDRNLADRRNVYTDRYSSHESTSTLSKYSRQLQLVAIDAGYLEPLDAPGLPGAKSTVAIRTLADNFADLDGDLLFDADTETKEVRKLAMVVTGPAPLASPVDPEQPAEFKAVVVADTTLFSDFVLARSQASAVYVTDALNWLVGEEAISGRTESEEDVTIEHTQGQQKLWFYGSTALVPLLTLLGGILHVSRRRRKSPPPPRTEGAA